LPWRFEPERTSIEVRLGEVVTVFYKVTICRSETPPDRRPITSRRYGGLVFHEINCFCFTEQRLAPREKREMAVVFYVDPVLMQDSEQDDLNTITLSYTFFALREPHLPWERGRPARTRRCGGTPALQRSGRYNEATIRALRPGGAAFGHKTETEMPTPTRNLITTTTWSIRAHGRRSARCRCSFSRSA